MDLQADAGRVDAPYAERDAEPSVDYYRHGTQGRHGILDAQSLELA